MNTKARYVLKKRLASLMFRTSVAVMSVWSLSVFSQTTESIAENSTDDAEALIAITREIKSYSASYEQTVTDDFGMIKDQAAGVFKLEHPNRFIWQTTQPFEQLIVSDGKDLWTFDQDLDQVNVQTLDTAIGSTPALFLSSNLQQIRETFIVKQIPSGSELAKTFELKPVNRGEAFARMLVLFKEGKLAELLLDDTLGQRTVVQFSDIELNQTFTEDTFVFRLPEGVDLIDSRQPDS